MACGIVGARASETEPRFVGPNRDEWVEYTDTIHAHLVTCLACVNVTSGLEFQREAAVLAETKATVAVNLALDDLAEYRQELEAATKGFRHAEETLGKAREARALARRTLDQVLRRMGMGVP